MLIYYLYNYLHVIKHCNLWSPLQGTSRAEVWALKCEQKKYMICIPLFVLTPLLRCLLNYGGGYPNRIINCLRELHEICYLYVVCISVLYCCVPKRKWPIAVFVGPKGIQTIKITRLPFIPQSQPTLPVVNCFI